MGVVLATSYLDQKNLVDVGRYYWQTAEFAAISPSDVARHPEIDNLQKKIKGRTDAYQSVGTEWLNFSG